MYLVGRKRRWWCERCKKAFTEEWPAVRKWSRRTVVAEAQILRLLRDNSFRGVEERYGISDEVSRWVLKRAKIGSGWEAESREWKIRLGIDEHSFRGRDLVITVTNLKRRRVVAVLPDDRQETLRRFMSEIPDSIRRRVEEVCVDMKPGFIEVVKQQLSAAAIVIDRFHVVQDGNRRLDEARRIEQEAVRKPIKKHLFLKAEERLSEKERQLLDYYLREYPALRE